MSRYACCDKHGLSRRDLLKGVAAGAVTAASPLAATAAKEGKKMTTTETMGQAPVAACKKVAADAPGAKAKVYFSRKIDAQTLIDLYERINEGIYGKVAIKLHTGEKNGPNILPRDMVKAFQATVPDSVIVETNTLYEGDRFTTEQHLETLKVNGWTFCPVDIMDAEGETALPVEGGRHLAEDYVGKNFLNYDFTVVLSHFKGHAMGGFGGAIKNISIGIASSGGKAWIHSAGTTKDVSKVWGNLPEQDNFLESMAEAAKAVTDHCGDKILYISVANNLSVDCDCDSSPEDPRMGDIGILASLDPVALDRACTDLVRSSEDHGKIHLIERIDSRHGMHTLDYAEQLGMGSQKYELVELK